MVKRSLQSSPESIQKAKRAFALKGWTQENLAGEVNLTAVPGRVSHTLGANGRSPLHEDVAYSSKNSCKTRQPIWRFFIGQPVEIAPFTQAQVTTFAQKWFNTLAQRNPQTGQAQSQHFMQKLELPENWQFRQLVVTPLFLHLACWMFQGQEKFPAKRSEFYRQGLDLLLGKWDEAKGIDRDDVYRDFRLPQKLRLLSQLATVTFEQGHYFFEQRLVEQYIEEYLQNLPEATLQPIVLDAALEHLLLQIATDRSPDFAYVNVYYPAWVAQVRAEVTRYRNIHHPWQFTVEQQQVLQRYYDANQLLVDYLNSNCEVTAAIRQKIEATLLLPQQELEDREWQGD